MPETQSARRLRWLLWSLLAWVGVIVLKLLSLQVWHHDELVKLAQQQQQKTVEIEAARGTIFDRTGSPLAKAPWALRDLIYGIVFIGVLIGLSPIAMDRIGGVRSTENATRPHGQWTPEITFSSRALP